MFEGAFRAPLAVRCREMEGRVRSILLSSLITLLALLGRAHAESYREVVLASGPLAYWPLDEASGSAIDASGHGHNGIAVGQPGYRSKSLLPNQRGFAVDLSSGSRFFVPPFPKFSDSSTGYTIAYWIMLAGPGGTYTQVVGDGVAGEQFYLMNYLHFDGRLLCPRPHYGANQGSWDPDPCTVGANLTAGKAHHVVTTWDRAAGKATVYIDGVAFVLIDKPTGVPAHTELQLWIGHDNREGGWNFTLDEVALWDRPLTPKEVNAQLAAASYAARQNPPASPLPQDSGSQPGPRAGESGLPDFLRGRFQWFDDGTLDGTIDFFSDGRARLSWSDLPHTWRIDGNGDVLIAARGNLHVTRLTFDSASKTFHGGRDASSQDQSGARTVLIPAGPQPTPVPATQAAAKTPGPALLPDKTLIMDEAVCNKLDTKWYRGSWEGVRCRFTVAQTEGDSALVPEGAQLKRNAQGRICWMPSSWNRLRGLVCLGTAKDLPLKLVNTFAAGTAAFVTTGPGNNYAAEFAKLRAFIEKYQNGTFGIEVQGGASKTPLKGRNPASAMADNLALAKARAQAALTQVKSDLATAFPALALRPDRVLESVVDGPDWNPRIPVTDPRYTPFQYVKVMVRMELLDH